MRAHSAVVHQTLVSGPDAVGSNDVSSIPSSDRTDAARLLSCLRIERRGSNEMDRRVAHWPRHGRRALSPRGEGRWRVENVQIVPVFGKNAVNLSPRVGHLHVQVDDLPWWWADPSNVHTYHEVVPG
jgi:Family of unknown function (DUF6130)